MDQQRIDDAMQSFAEAKRLAAAVPQAVKAIDDVEEFVREVAQIAQLGVDTHLSATLPIHRDLPDLKPEEQVTG